MPGRQLRKRPLTIREILHWADIHHAQVGKWPIRSTQPVIGALHETWDGIDAALRAGNRGLPGGSSLAQLLSERRAVPNRKARPPLSEDQVLAWADAHHARTGIWPTTKSGAIPNSQGECWSFVDAALRYGTRGFPGGSSLPRLLGQRRGARNRKALPVLTEHHILAWCDAVYERTGGWPSHKDGPIPDAPGETWLAVEMALNHGQRGMPGGSSLALLLAEKRGARHRLLLPELTIQQVLAWVDAHRQRTGRWPHIDAGAVHNAPSESWRAIHNALQRGTRGLPGGCTLSELLAIERNVRNRKVLPSLNRKQILVWADEHRRRTGDWPQVTSGPVIEAPGETWSGLNAALKQGSRGLKRGRSLAQLLAIHRGKQLPLERPPLTIKKILAWADAHQQRTGMWPNINSGEVQDAPGEYWRWIDNALRRGDRGLSGTTSLHRLLVRKRGIRNPLALTLLAEEQILQWANEHHYRTGRWPRAKSGPIHGVPGETWLAVDYALRKGKRGLSGESSLATLLAQQTKDFGEGLVLQEVLT